MTKTTERKRNCSLYQKERVYCAKCLSKIVEELDERIGKLEESGD